MFIIWIMAGRLPKFRMEIPAFYRAFTLLVEEYDYY
jgi:hypothetical protein